jgi:uncharacterized protein (DUF302 family)
MIRNLLALIGVVALVGLIMMYPKIQTIYSFYHAMDDDTKQFLGQQFNTIQNMDEAKVKDIISQAKQLDPKAWDTYISMADDLLKTGNSAEATVWKIPVEDGLSAEEVEETMKFVANEHNFANVGELPLSKDIEAKTGEDFRFIKLFLFCDSLIAAEMLNYSGAFSAYLPCRIALIEDKEGKLWLYTLNMDMMIYGGKTLPAELYDKAVRVKEIILDIMNRGATGEF